MVGEVEVEEEVVEAFQMLLVVEEAEEVAEEAILIHLLYFVPFVLHFS